MRSVAFREEYKLEMLEMKPQDLERMMELSHEGYFIMRNFLIHTDQLVSTGQ
jgi:hypothetical protein